MIQLQSLSRTIQVVLLFFSLFGLFNLTFADPPYNICSNTTNYTADSLFQYNLNHVLSNLISNASVSKFYNDSSVNDTDTVYGLFMCLGYITNENCLNCITMASQDILQLCPYDTEAVVWEEVCHLRYSNQNFIGHLDVTGNIGKDNIINISEPKQFDSLVNVTLSNLTKKAAFDPSANKYATGEVTFLDSDTLYALVQCTGDLSADDCSACLQAAIKDIPSCCYASRGARVLSRSCYLRYELYAFYEGQTENSAPDPNKGKRTGSQRKILVTVSLSIVSASLAVVSLGICLCCFAKKVRNERGNVAELIDPTLTDSCRPDEFSLYIHIGLLCVQQDANDRPTMSSVAVMLRSETSTLSQPQRPPFSVGRFGADDNSCSVNGVTTSDAFPRVVVSIM
ncbi:hypothetical protein HS088_TW21G00759 [Tripterygium wilfordii]|uniref:Gnk2-homologous domain-containing protein n=1 Tax=Tripterygium wilfordii TaxID=458696 RepID=A0A7J7C3C6_TRIWF|nr:hypothetical protein HS088_TW21G00759 [Tripterygium wilfordii]